MDKDVYGLVYNFLCDLKKKDIDKFARARLINEYMRERNLSIRQLAKQLNIPKSTIEDWVRWAQLPQEEYKEYKEQGFTHTDIYESLRDGTLAERRKENLMPILDLTKKDLAIDRMLRRCISTLEVFKIKPPYSSETKKHIAQLRKILDTIESQIK